MSITRISSFPAIRILGSRFPRTFQWLRAGSGLWNIFVLERELVGRVTTQVNVWVNRHIGKCVAHHEINGYIVGDPYSRFQKPPLGRRRDKIPSGLPNFIDWNRHDLDKNVFCLFTETPVFPAMLSLVRGFFFDQTECIGVPPLGSIFVLLFVGKLFQESEKRSSGRSSDDPSTR